MIHSFPVWQNKGRLPQRKRADVFQRQPCRFSASEAPGVFSFHVIWRHPSPLSHSPPPNHFLRCFLLYYVDGGRPAGHVTGHFHCKEGRQEVEMKTELSAASLNTGPQRGQVTVNSHNMGEGRGRGGTNGLDHTTLFDLTWSLYLLGPNMACPHPDRATGGPIEKPRNS